MTATACDDQWADDRDAALDAMVMEVQPHEWRQGGAMRYAGHTITWGEYVQRRHEMEEEFTVEPALDRDEMLQLLALRLKSWPQDCDDCERTEPAGWGWRWYDVPPDCEFVLEVPGREGREWCITESDWRKACWDAGEKRIERIAQSDASGDHYEAESLGYVGRESRELDELMKQSVAMGLRMGKQARYQDAHGDDWIDEFARTATPEEFRGAMRFTVGKYLRRVGKKDAELSEVRKMRDYCQRWEAYLMAQGGEQ